MLRLHFSVKLLLLIAVMNTHLLVPSEICATQFQIETEDHLVLAFKPNGNFQILKTHKQNILSPQSPSGIWLYDVVTGKEENCLGYVEPTHKGIVFSGNVQNMELKVHAKFIPTKDYIQVVGSVENLSDHERAVDVMFRFYYNALGAQWYRDIHVSKTLAEEETFKNTIYPFHGLALLDNWGAFALGVSAEEPAVYKFSYENGEYYELKLKYGLSKYASGRLYKKAHFNVLLYRISPEWGFRSVVHRYYQFHKKWFKRRAKRNGLWLMNSAVDVPNPWDYAYREGGPNGWEYDEAHDIATCPYLILGQRELKHLSTLPDNYEKQVKIFEGYKDYDNAGLKDIIVNCGLYDEQNRFRILPRETSWGGKSLTFPVNPDPDLYFDQPVVTVGKMTLEWVRWILGKYPFLDGIYIDSLASWGRYYNCRKDHFPYAQISLTYDPESNSPAIYNKFAHQEYLYALQEILHPERKLIFANGIRPGRFFNGMAVDILGSENSIASLVKTNYRKLIFHRTVAYQKPYMLLNNHKAEILDIEQVEYFWQIGLFFGIYPGFHREYQKDSKLYEKYKHIISHYNPLIKQLNEAGWEPLTFAKTNKSEIWIERFGDITSDIYFTLMNTSDQKQNVTVTLDKKKLRLANGFSAVELVDMDELTINANQIRCTLDGKTCKLLKIMNKNL